MKESMENQRKRLWTTIPPIIIIGAVVILASILLFVTIEDINRQKDTTEKLLLERGNALIRSFEAGTKTGVLGMQWDSPQIRKWLTETAQQPGIQYLLVTDHEGKILAHSDPLQIGRIYGRDMDLSGIAETGVPQWRKIKGERNRNIFEVSSRCDPLPGQLTTYIRTDSPHEWLRLRISAKESEAISGLVMFVGLDMEPLEAARREDTRNTVFAALILLLIGFAGMISLLLAHGYRSARTTLTKIKAFSDTLVENMPIGIVALDVDGRITSCNVTAESLLELMPGETIGNPAGEILPGPLWNLVSELAPDDHIMARELECPMGSGKTRPLDVTVTMLEGSDGEFLGHVILLRDLTEIRRLRREVERTQRLASLGRLAAGIAHEIRNPLSSIKGFAHYFGERYKDVPQDHETAQIMVQEVDRLNRVIGELLEFARPMDMNFRKVSLSNLIRNSLRLIEDQARAKDIVITTSLSPRDETAYIDPDRVGQVVLNIYLNAIQAMDGGGMLSVGLTRVNSREVAVTVSDTGKGIPKQDLHKIFDPYYTTKPSGTGLGLAIVHRIIEAHNGSLRVESDIGKGTIVSFTVPTDGGAEDAGE